jgi:hypothetical protein
MDGRYEVFKQTLAIEEGWSTEYPLHGMFDEVRLRCPKTQVPTCIIIRIRSTDAREQASDDQQMEKLGEEYICFDLEMDGQGRILGEYVTEAAAALALGCFNTHGMDSEKLCKATGYVRDASQDGGVRG